VEVHVHVIKKYYVQDIYIISNLLIYWSSNIISYDNWMYLFLYTLRSTSSDLDWCIRKDFVFFERLFIGGFDLLVVAGWLCVLSLLTLCPKFLAHLQ
jgi:hypothetical protein